MEIRKIKKHELNQLLELYKDLHDDDELLPGSDAIQKVWRKIQSNEDFVCFGTFEGSRLIASCCLVLIANLTRGCRPYGVIENVVTHHECRRQGLGCEILKHALNYAWANNAYKVMLLTGRLNEDTYKFYESVGFDRHAKQAFIAKPPKSVAHC